MSNFKWVTVTTFILFVVLQISTINSVFAGTIQVPKNHKTIGKALAAAKKGDTVQVAKGTYVENLIMKQGVILEGGYSSDYSKRDIAANETIIDGSKNKGPVIQLADGGTLDGFTIINGSRKILSDKSTIGSGVYSKGITSVVSNNTVMNNEPAGIFFSGAKGTVKNNLITKNKEAGVFLEKASDITIVANVIKENNFAGISAGDKPINKPNSKLDVRNNRIFGNGKAGIDSSSASGTFYNNVIYKNSDAGIRSIIPPVEFVNNTIVANSRSGIIIVDPSVVPVIKNNIIAHNEEGGIRSAKGGYSYNLLYSNFLSGDCNPEYLWCVRNNFGGYEDEEHYKKVKNIIANPLFVSEDKDNYRLRGGSPAIDGGDPDKKLRDVNFAPSLGTPVNDMGAYGGPHSMPEERDINNAPSATFTFADPIYFGGRIKLDGRKSVDTDGDSIKFQWKLLSKPAGSKAKFKRANKKKASLKADKAGDYEVELVVTDRLGKASKANVQKVKVLGNHPPKANVGEILSHVKQGDTVTVYGSGSKDKDKDPLKFKWEIIYKPAKSKAAIVDKKAENASFQVDAKGSFGIQLIVNDGKVDSKPTVVYVSTGHKAVNGIRNVPAEYPAIQLAVDAADPGDTVLVQKGTYLENIIIDKNVNLKGLDWPVVDGGSKKGNTNTIQFAYLGDSAGKIEGFVITGGGLGGLGHGLNVWDSSPEIYNNKIHGNRHNGIGIHGRGTLTAKTKIHNNMIYDNGLGIGNGLGSSAHIYNNRIFKNRIVGVGARGLALPRIEGNYIYENRMGIGTREVSAPVIIGNHIYNNINGIVIGPSSTIKKYSGPDILIKNNLVYNNSRVGIAATSFNLSKIIVVNNTIDGNNSLDIMQRAGGLVLGWPGPAEFTAVVENNIITNNQYAGIASNTGLDQFPAPGAIVKNVNNLVYENAVEYEGAKPGKGDISEDPKYVKGDTYDSGQYFLAGDSPAVDSGIKSSREMELNKMSTQKTKAADKGKVDMGYHYPKKGEKFIEKSI